MNVEVGNSRSGWLDINAQYDLSASVASFAQTLSLNCLSKFKYRLNLRNDSIQGDELSQPSLNSLKGWLQDVVEIGRTELAFAQALSQSATTDVYSKKFRQAFNRRSIPSIKNCAVRWLRIGKSRHRAAAWLWVGASLFSV